MEKNNEEWVEYSFENTVQLLQNKFHSSLILLVQPARMIQNLAEFDNLTKTGEGAAHLHFLLINAYKEIELKTGNKLSENLPIHLVSFSKGCMVINHLLAELASVKKFKKEGTKSMIDWDDRNFTISMPSFESFLKIERTSFLGVKSMQFGSENGPSSLTLLLFDKVRSIFILDAHRFLTERNCILNCFGDKIRPSVFVFQTPRQMGDKKRVYIKKGLDIFLDLMKQSQKDVPLTFKLFFQDEKPSLSMHFKILDVFQPIIN